MDEVAGNSRLQYRIAGGCAPVSYSDPIPCGSPEMTKSLMNSLRQAQKSSGPKRRGGRVGDDVKKTATPADGMKQLGQRLRAEGKPEEARTALSKAAGLQPEDHEAWTMLGSLEMAEGRHDEARAHFERALHLAPEDPDAHQGMAAVLYLSSQDKSALRHIDLALEKRPDHAIAQVLKVQILTRLYKMEEAEALCKALIAASQDAEKNVTHWNDLGNVYRGMGMLKEAEAAYRKAASLTKIDPVPLSNWLTLLHYMPDRSLQDILEGCREWARRFAPTRSVQRPVPADRSPNRKLRVGMYSDGFRQHPVGAMTTSALEQLSRLGFELYFYTTNSRVDEIARRLMAVAARWTQIANIRDERLAKLIQDDGIDILIDLSGHNAGNRIRTMTLQPAPVLMKWVGGLINTTGVEAIDYLITDNIESPPGSDADYTEKLIRMPDDYICYVPPSNAPDVSALPALKNGYITFGCFNNPAKVNEVVLEQWARLLHAVPQSRLYLKGGAYGSEALRRNILDSLQRHGVDAGRVRLEGHSVHQELLQCYNEIDIALDPWPYSGGLTTCEAMLMGVPVITLPGPTFAGRHSATHLINAGMPELVVQSWDEYIARGVELAGDLRSLATIRSHLREVLVQSPVCDSTRFARNLANALRAVWQRYCDNRGPAGLSIGADGQARFDDDDAPIELQHPPALNGDEAAADGDGSFQFTFQGKIVTVDHGVALASRPYFRDLAWLQACTVVAVDPASRLAHAEALQREGRVQHYHAHVAFGDGSPGVLYACLDSALSGTLEPLPHATLPASLRHGATVLTKLPLPTTRLDDIAGLERVDWLFLDDTHDHLKILDGGRRLIGTALMLQCRIRFLPTYRGQADLGALSAALGAMGFRLLRLDHMQYASQMDGSPHTAGETGSQLLTADAIYVPDDARLDRMEANDLRKLAFIAHTAYRCTDLAHHVLKRIDEATADAYFESLKEIAQEEALTPAEPGATPAMEVPASEAAPLRPIPTRDTTPPVVQGAASPADIVVPDLPHMEPEGQALLRTCLEQAEVFLEYGSGGSSVMAADSPVRRIYSVASDLEFLRAVHRKLLAAGTSADKYVPLHADIGPTGAWGRPQDTNHATLWPLYARTPWAAMADQGDVPDLILIDGRFRVATFLISVMLAPKGCTILFDDYFDRPAYHVVERYLKPAQAAGRMARFVVSGSYSDGLILDLLKYCTNPA